MEFEKKAFYRSFQLLFLVFCFLFINNALAIENSESLVKEIAPIEKNMEDCLKKKRGNIGRRECYATALNEWDIVLNKIYRSKLDKLSSYQITLLKRSQINWIKHRDAEFAFIEDFFNKEGSMYSTLIVHRKMEFVKKRVIQLGTFYYVDE